MDKSSAEMRLEPPPRANGAAPPDDGDAVHATVAQAFDVAFYLTSNLDVAASDLDPVRHYIEYGAREGRDPVPYFSTKTYLRDNPKLIESGINPFYHYLVSEARLSQPISPAKHCKLNHGPLDISTNHTPEVTKIKQKPLTIQPLFGLSDQYFDSNATVFTCVIGDRHALTHNTTQYSDLLLYGDNDLRVPGWQRRAAFFWDPTPKRIVLFHKYQIVNFSPIGQKFIWVDSRVSAQKHIIDSMFDVLDEHELCVFRHSERDCVHDEIDAVLAGNRATAAECDSYHEFFRLIGFPRHDGIFETGLIGFRVTADLRRAFRRLFGLCFRFAPRDQLALPVALRDFPLKTAVFNDGRTHLRNTPGVFVHTWQRDKSNEREDHGDYSGI